MINSWQTITRGGCVSKAWKPLSSRLILIYFKFRSKPSLITVICMDPHSPNKLFATKYCFLILGDEFLFLNHFFIFRLFIYLFFVILCYFVIINFYKNYVIIIIFLIIFFFHENYFYFSCSGMLRDLSTPTANGLNFRIINWLMEFWGVRLTWLDCKLIMTYDHWICGHSL